MKKLGNIDFYKNRKKYFIISLAVICIGLIVNVIFGTELSISFSGGATVTYSYTGEALDLSEVEKIAEDATGRDCTVTRGTELNSGDAEGGSVKISFAGKTTLSDDQLTALTEAMNENYEDSALEVSDMQNVNPTIGTSFLLKGLYTIAIAGALMVLYVAFRFRKIGGWSAGLFALIAVLHDCLVVYLAYVVFRIPLNDNFIAVILTILGYSLNDTIVIYDRIRENRRVLPVGTDIAEISNISLNQTIHRSIATSITTFIASATIAIVCAIMGVTSIISFAVPMSIGVVVGAYSSICIAIPLWVMWQKSSVKANKKTKTAKKKRAIK